MNFQTICRICLEANSKMVSIFESYNFSSNDSEIYKVITDCASVQIQRLDGFSEQICRSCLNRLSQAYNFKKLCEDSDYKFRNDLIVKDEIEVKTESFEEMNYVGIVSDLKENADKKNKMTDLELTQVKIEQSDDEIKTEYDFDNSLNGIQTKLDTTRLTAVFESTEYKGDSQCTNNDTNCNSDFFYNCELCSKFFATKEYLALHMKGQHPHICSDYKLGSDLIANDKIRIKNEFVKEETMINYGELHNDITENADETTDFRLNEVIEEQCNEEIRSHENSDNDQDEIDLEIMEYDALKNSQSYEKNGASNSSHECELCNKILPTKRSMDLHMKAHAGHELHKCNVCSKEFLKSRYLTQHMKMHRGEQPVQSVRSKTQNSFICEICGRHFQHRHRLMEHLVSHTGEKPYNCELCEKKFTHKYELAIHGKVHTGEKPHKCNVCNKSFIRKTYLVNHSRLHSGEKPHKCDICDRKFSRKHHLVSHIRTHTGEKPYTCDICDKKFAEKSDLTLHHGRLHTEENLFKCEGVGATSQIKMQGEEKPYKCDFCDKTFLRKGYLIMHTRLHTGEKPFKCDFCDKQFADGTNLRVHIRLHTGEKPYKCNFCLKKFADRSSLRVHIRTHTCEEPYKCDVCDKHFKQSSGLLRHFKSHT